jgi:hypothetical protein
VIECPPKLATHSSLFFASTKTLVGFARFVLAPLSTRLGATFPLASASKTSTDPAASFAT